LGTFRGLVAGSAAGGGSAGGGAMALSGTRRKVTSVPHPTRGHVTLSVARPALANRFNLRPHWGQVPAIRSRSCPTRPPPPDYG